MLTDIFRLFIVFDSLRSPTLRPYLYHSALLELILTASRLFQYFVSHASTLGYRSWTGEAGLRLDPPFCMNLNNTVVFVHEYSYLEMNRIDVMSSVSHQYAHQCADRIEKPSDP